MVELTASASGYNPANTTVTINISKGEQPALTWTGNNIQSRIDHHYGENSGLTISVKYGKSYPLINPPTGGHGGIHYNVSSGGGCSVDRDTGELRGIRSSGNCYLYAKWWGNDDYKHSSASGFRDMWLISAPGDIEFDGWGSYGFLRVGRTDSAPTVTVSSPADTQEAWVLVDNTGCSLGSNGALTSTIAGVDNCKVKRTLSKTHYTSQSHTYTLTVLAQNEIGVKSWGFYGGYGFRTNVANEAAAPTLVHLDPSDAVKSYVVNGTTTICQVNQTTGYVTRITNGTCNITLTVSKNGFNSVTHEYSFFIYN